MKVSVYKPANHIVAHRGAFKKNGFPENSIASLKEAIASGNYRIDLGAIADGIIRFGPKSPG